MVQKIMLFKVTVSGPLPIDQSPPVTSVKNSPDHRLMLRLFVLELFQTHCYDEWS